MELLCRFFGLLRYLRPRESRFKPAVEMYPDKVSGKTPEDMFPRMKGYLANNLSKCTGCGDCVRLCPIQALSLTAESNKDGSLHVKAFSIDLGKCFSCSLCVDNCPVGSITHTREYEIATATRGGMLVEEESHQVARSGATKNEDVRVQMVVSALTVLLAILVLIGAVRPLHRWPGPASCLVYWRLRWVPVWRSGFKCATPYFF